MREELQNIKIERDNLNDQLLDQSRSLDEKDQELHSLLNIQKQEKATGFTPNSTAKENNFWHEATPEEKVNTGSGRAVERATLTSFKESQEGARRASKRDKGTGSSMNATATSGFNEKRATKRSQDGRPQVAGVINHNNHVVKSASEGPTKQSTSAKKGGNIN